MPMELLRHSGKRTHSVKSVMRYFIFITQLQQWPTAHDLSSFGSLTRGRVETEISQEGSKVP